jgi:hypothetical protein
VYEQILGALSNKSEINHIHNEYVTKEEIDELIKENVSKVTDEFFSSVNLDAGKIIERS